MKQNIKIHKSSEIPSPKLSIILLDWSCREHFQALKWLNRQQIDRQDYELIWVELYDRVVPETLELADTVITCGQTGLYHKHLGYNAGVMHAKGKLITICDSDAVFPDIFVDSIFKAFKLNLQPDPVSLVLMHYQWRSPDTYPDGFDDLDDIKKYRWKALSPNVGACMTVRMEDTIRYGGFDEHKSYRGYLCGPYDLGWRLINAGIPEFWNDESVALWHFAHPEPLAGFGQEFSWKRWFERAHPHFEHHALLAVNAFSSGKILPKKENTAIFELRTARRIIGTQAEERYSRIAGSTGFNNWRLIKIYAGFFFEPFSIFFRKLFIKSLKKILGEERFNLCRIKWRVFRKKPLEEIHS